MGIDFNPARIPMIGINGIILKPSPVFYLFTYPDSLDQDSTYSPTFTPSVRRSRVLRVLKVYFNCELDGWFVGREWVNIP